jgi:hypothetical protein
MSKKLGLHIGGRRFDVDVEDEFATFLLQQMSKEFKLEGNNDVKALLQAYVRKNHELFMQEKKMQALVSQLEDI